MKETGISFETRENDPLPVTKFVVTQGKTRKRSGYRRDRTKWGVRKVCDTNVVVTRRERG